ncbi:MAG TPA: hypothetical protein VLW85_25255 [Myxococcales bacterium]|nr:hypothetical protein [Myxococcales bacterium]
MGQGQAILIVRDRLGLTGQIEAALEDAGLAEVVVADDMARAVAMFEKGPFAKGELPAMVIVPPLADSFLLLDALRTQERTRAVPVFVVRALPPEQA